MLNKGGDMKIPDKLKVAGHEYKIKWDDEYLSNEGYVGLSIHNKLLVFLCKIFRGTKLSKSIIEETLLHEILHCVDANYNNHLLSEETVDRLSAGLYQVLKDNFNL